MIDFEKFGSDKATRHSYREFYEDLIIRFKVRRVFEVGIHQGGSAKAFLEVPEIREYVGCDIAPCRFTAPRFEFLLGNFRSAMSGLAGRGFDLLIDDGSHRISEQIEFLALAEPLTAPGGTVVIEDIQKPDQQIPLLLTHCPPGWTCGLYDGRQLTRRYDDIIIFYRKPLIYPGPNPDFNTV